jgi:uncharacterized membrane protein
MTSPHLTAVQSLSLCINSVFHTNLTKLPKHTEVSTNVGTLIYIALDDVVPPQWMNWAFCLTLIIAFVLLLFVKEQYKRTNIDQKEAI